MESLRKRRHCAFGSSGFAVPITLVSTGLGARSAVGAKGPSRSFHGAGCNRDGGITTPLERFTVRLFYRRSDLHDELALRASYCRGSSRMGGSGADALGNALSASVRHRPSV